jgi:hypothetical protein
LLRLGCQPWFKKRGKVLSRPINRIVIAEIYDVDLQNLSHIIELNVQPDADFPVYSDGIKAFLVGDRFKVQAGMIRIFFKKLDGFFDHKLTAAVFLFKTSFKRRRKH